MFNRDDLLLLKIRSKGEHNGKEEVVPELQGKRKERMVQGHSELRA